jgi:uncharacterized protein (DUF1800 family)
MGQTVTRRQFLVTSGLMAAWAALAACQPKNQFGNTATTAPSTPTTAPTAGGTPAPGLGTAVPQSTANAAPTGEDTGDQLLAHVLRRLTFGATPDLAAHARAIGVEAFIEEQLNPEKLDDSQVSQMLSGFTTLTLSPADRLQLSQKGLPAQELTAATLLREAYSPRQLYELVVDFWSNHFNIYIAKDLCRVLKTDDDAQVIRANAMGKFSDVLNASAHSPAMLVYLDQASSNKNVPNENYARELMELHTISVAALYGPSDVVDVARAFTGWTLAGPKSTNPAPGSFIYRPQIHDDGEKTILDLHLPAGQGEKDGQQVLDYLSRHPLTAQFISTKLARRFVADNPPAALVDHLAATFTATGGDTRAMLNAMFASPEFRSASGQKFKRPLEFFISALRVSGADIGSQPGPLYQQLRLLGQLPFEWLMPNGYPDLGPYWATTGGLLNRWNFGMRLMSNQFKGTHVDLQAATRDAASAGDVVDVLSLRFIGEKLPADARSILIDFAASGNLGTNLAPIAGLILGSPHFQLR